MPKDLSEGGFGIGHYSDFNASIPQHSTQYIKYDELNGYLELLNGYRSDNKFLVMTLLDYRVIDFNYNNSVSKIHFVNMPPMKTFVSQYNITDIPSGYHDIVILTFLNPYNLSRNDSYRLLSPYLINNIRFNVIRDNDNKPFIEYKNMTKTNVSISDGVFVIKEANASVLWLYENVSDNETLQYQINVENTKYENMSYALIQLLDYEQIPLKYSTSEYVYYGLINKSETCSIPASLKVTGHGAHELVVILVTYPYEDYELVPGIINTNAKVQSSMRIELNVT